MLLWWKWLVKLPPLIRWWCLPWEKSTQKNDFRFNRRFITKQSDKSAACVSSLSIWYSSGICVCNSQTSGSSFVFSQLHQTLLQQAKPPIINLHTVCLDTLPCRHIDGHFLCIPRAERIDSTSIHVWTAGESSHRSLSSQTDSQYSQVWKAGQYWATGERASGGAGPDWVSWYPISW